MVGGWGHKVLARCHCGSFALRCFPSPNNYKDMSLNDGNISVLLTRSPGGSDLQHNEMEGTLCVFVFLILQSFCVWRQTFTKDTVCCKRLIQTHFVKNTFNQELRQRCSPGESQRSVSLYLLKQVAPQTECRGVSTYCKI